MVTPAHVFPVFTQTRLVGVAAGVQQKAQSLLSGILLMLIENLVLVFIFQKTLGVSTLSGQYFNSEPLFYY